MTFCPAGADDGVFLDVLDDDIARYAGTLYGFASREER